MALHHSIPEHVGGSLLTDNHSHPIAHMPPEILALIFWEMLQVSENKIHKVLAISKGCQRWRNITLATPMLWEWIDTRNVDGIKTPLIRAGNRPLSIVLVVLLRANSH
ncbi:hypothetical protein BDN72DRAFT_390581 [Pluteus cervinus]|uniref:Uncharacterized protein n=1 Tax=Pluteus cervinus TaxID=181527 RepID=A0ACD3AC95_9AGAR|nr:hypothetical protein BDN72DRAFT_390581 [Pluteus cervinus]